MSRTIPRTALLLVLIAGCGSRIDFSSRVTSIDDADPRWVAAIQKARDHCDEFIAVLNAPGPGQERFAVKKKFTDGEVTEHLWLAAVRYEGTTFHGRVSNVPKSLPHVKYGDAASVPRDEISDWMYWQDGKIVGAETLRVMRDTLTAAERADFDRALPLAE